jgi:hypothetical protein
VEPLPFGIFSDANPTIKVGAIILMDGVAKDAAEPTVGVSQPLQPGSSALSSASVQWRGEKCPRTRCAARPPPASAAVPVVTLGRGLVTAGAVAARM